MGGGVKSSDLRASMGNVFRCYRWAEGIILYLCALYEGGDGLPE